MVVTATYRVIHEISTLRLGDFRPPPHTHTPVYARALLAYTPSHPSTSTQIEYMTSTYFAKHYQSKNHKKRYKMKRLLTKPSKNIESKYPEIPEIEFAPFNCKGKLECTVLVIRITHVISFLFCNEHVKNFYDERTLTAKFTSH